MAPRLVNYLSSPETDALLAAPDRQTRCSRRDHVLLRLAVQTGLRVSELIGLRCGDVTFGRAVPTSGASERVQGTVCSAVEAHRQARQAVAAGIQGRP